MCMRDPNPSGYRDFRQCPDPGEINNPSSTVTEATADTHGCYLLHKATVATAVRGNCRSFQTIYGQTVGENHATILHK